MAQPIKITVGTFIDYVNSTPGEQSKIVQQQKTMYLDSNRQPWNYYGPIIDAIRDEAEHGRSGAVAAVVAGVTGTPKEIHFTEILNGWAQWRAGVQFETYALGRSSWTAAGVVVTVNPHVGIRLASGEPLVIAFYTKRPALRRQSADIALRVMQKVVPDIALGAEPAILDVRRGKLITVRRNLSKPRLDASLAGVIASYSAIWNAIA